MSVGRGKFVIVGTATVDLFVRGMDRLPHVGDDGFRASNLVFTREPLAMLLGGNAGCSAYALGALGAEAVLFSGVGDDALGEQMQRWLREYSVNLNALHVSSTHATSTSTIVATDAHEQIVFHHGGANQDLPARLPEALLQQASVLLLSSYPILPSLRPDGFAHALQAAQGHSALTALDVGPAIGDPVLLRELVPLLPHVDFLIANEHELAACTALGDAAASAGHLLRAGARHVLVKRGARGSTLYAAGDGAGDGAVEGDVRRIDTPAFPVAANFTAGAGDSFNSGFLYGVQQGWSLAEALRFGSATAALVVASPRGILGAPTREQVEQFLGSMAKAIHV